MTDFLFDLGTNGWVGGSVNIMTTELNSLANGSGATSSVAGASGVISGTQTQACVMGEVWFKLGGSITPGAGGYIAVYFVTSTDGGTTFEVGTALKLAARPPDAIIPAANVSYATSDVLFAPGAVRIPSASFKVFVVNNLGGALAATNNVLTLGPMAVRH